MERIGSSDVDRIIQEVISEFCAAGRIVLDESWRRVTKLMLDRIDLGPYERTARPLVNKIFKQWGDLVEYLSADDQKIHLFAGRSAEMRLAGYFKDARSLLALVRSALPYLPDGGDISRTAACDVLEEQERYVDMALREYEQFISHTAANRPEDPYVAILQCTSHGFRNLMAVHQSLLAVVLGTERIALFEQQYNECIRSLNDSVGLLQLGDTGYRM